MTTTLLDRSPNTAVRDTSTVDVLGLGATSLVGPSLDAVRAEDLPCWTEDPGLWFAEHPVHIDQAKALCAQCPVRVACFEEALARRESCGVWGGHLFVDGRVVAHKRGRGRPRKNATGPKATSAPPSASKSTSKAKTKTMSRTTPETMPPGRNDARRRH